MGISRLASDDGFDQPSQSCRGAYRSGKVPSQHVHACPVTGFASNVISYQCSRLVTTRLSMGSGYDLSARLLGIRKQGGSRSHLRVRARPELTLLVEATRHALETAERGRLLPSDAKTVRKSTAA